MIDRQCRPGSEPGSITKDPLHPDAGRVRTRRRFRIRLLAVSRGRVSVGSRARLRIRCPTLARLNSFQALMDAILRSHSPSLLPPHFFLVHDPGMARTEMTTIWDGCRIMTVFNEKEVASTDLTLTRHVSRPARSAHSCKGGFDQCPLPNLGAFTEGPLRDTVVLKSHKSKQFLHKSRYAWTRGHYPIASWLPG